MGIMIETLDAFGAAMREAEKYRKILRQRFGLTDYQIGTMVQGRGATKSRNYLSDYGKAVIAAKRRLEQRS
jgi:hypothetical protein